ncbi:hypothetical protein P7L79_12690 [Tistrella mobilis]|uniref:hypothetical protein n=1 Tax=Tistrella mobilis TaxID=171437 RepID=UPI003557ED03
MSTDREEIEQILGLIEVSPEDYDGGRTWDEISAHELLVVVGADADRIVLESPTPVHVRDAWGREAIAALHAVAGREIPYTAPRWVTEAGVALNWTPTHWMPLSYAECVARDCVPAWVREASDDR